MESGLSTVTARLMSPVSLPIARTLSLSRLPAHFPTVLGAFLCFQLLEWVSPIFLIRICPIHFGYADSRMRHNWVVRVVSMAHALIIIPLAFLCLDLPELDQDRAFGFDDRIGHVCGIACGFLWDTFDSILHFDSIGFVVHGAICLTVYSLGFRPFLAYYGARFLLWELSTPFLNIHWILDKTNRTGGSLQIINGVLFLTTFFVARLCYGGWMSVRFFCTLKEVQADIPTVVVFAYALGNVALQGLNWFWFYKMLLALRKRLSSSRSHQTLHGLNDLSGVQAPKKDD